MAYGQNASSSDALRLPTSKLTKPRETLSSHYATCLCNVANSQTDFLWTFLYNDWEQSRKSGNCEFCTEMNVNMYKGKMNAPIFMSFSVLNPNMRRFSHPLYLYVLGKNLLLIMLNQKLWKTPCFVVIIWNSAAMIGVFSIWNVLWFQK